MTEEQREAARLLSNSEIGMAYWEAVGVILARKRAERGVTTFDEISDDELALMLETAAFEASVLVDPGVDQDQLREDLSAAHQSVQMDVKATTKGGASRN